MTKKSFRRHLPLLVGGLVLFAVVVGIVFMIRGFLNDADQPKKRVVQQISLIKPPPPPPPDKPPPPPPPEQPKEEVKMNEPPPEQPHQDAPPPGNLGVDAKGTGSGDGFGLEGRPGGRDITLGGGGSRFKGYLGGLQQSLKDELNRSEKLRKVEYKVIVQIWLARNGSVERFQVLGSGDAEIDAEIRRILGSMKPFNEPPPDMPEPVKLRVSSR
ncbi:MAG: TonB C-terminal domain-containing protein [Burkholderiales bacterium]|nr:TonB C-terminal domain-containing protein [Burkholderiales bacterium]